MWGDVSEFDIFSLVGHLTKLEGKMARIRFPANESLYLCETMADDDTFVALYRDVDPLGEFCIGPSCERGWYPDGMTAPLPAHINRGPWQDLSSFGIALVESETALIEQNPTIPTAGPPHLHSANIYVSPEDPTTIVSITDWQSIVVSPLYLQARFPKLLPIDEGYVLGLTDLPKLPENYDEMDAGDKEQADEKFLQAKLAKAYEISSGADNVRALEALRIPSLLRELFVRCGKVSEEGIMPLRACIIQQFTEYRNYHTVHELARKWLCTDFEGCYSPLVDFELAQKSNTVLLEEFVKRSSEYGMTPAQVRDIWPFRERVEGVSYRTR
ncbi:hypothetical protein BCR34DRAFT_610932 [Clohesyomyces aquaticus]|uniref:Aminoglycoside phosphotransferase domain-containing protein n=1 Tax=Clohesyomyces aquaticus TaxID=1231657 RepID=A0A1Y2A4P3_9PLEO|nr:hypothetical protein BCR34DRAFT_610932 [Clohesyomyces aquaticus]